MKNVFACIMLLLSFNALSASAKECPYGTLFGRDNANEFIAYSKHLEEETYTENKSQFISEDRVAQIKKAIEVKSLKAAFNEVDEGMIHKFEIPGNSKTSYNFLTVVYASKGDTLVGAVFPDDSSVVWAQLDDSDIRVCEPSGLK